MTQNRWTIEKVENLETRELAPDYLNKETRWTFSSDDTATFEMNNDFHQISNSGTWQLKADTIFFSSPQDSAIMLIDELTDSSLTWTWPDRKVRFYLKKLKNKKPAANKE